MSSKYELQNIISGNAAVRHGKIIQTIAHFLREKKRAVQESQETEFLKDQETKVLVEYIDESKYIGEGTEQKVYEHEDP